MTDTITKSIDTIHIVIEEENGVEYVHVKRSDSERFNKDAHYFPKGDEKGALEFLNSIASLCGLGAIQKV